MHHTIFQKLFFRLIKMKFTSLKKTARANFLNFTNYLKPQKISKTLILGNIKITFLLKLTFNMLNLS
jgi:hypothetical protein